MKRDSSNRSQERLYVIHHTFGRLYGFYFRVQLKNVPNTPFCDNCAVGVLSLFHFSILMNAKIVIKVQSKLIFYMSPVFITENYKIQKAQILITYKKAPKILSSNLFTSFLMRTI